MRIGRVYDKVEKGYHRVLADRLWPRGVRKEDPRAGQWWPQLAPSDDLRQWYDHDVDRFEDFASRYRDELSTGEGAEALAELQDLARQEPVMLVTATKDLEHSHLTVLADLAGK